MSRILFLSQLLPYPPDAGPKVRSYYVLRHLAQTHQVTLLAFSRPDDSPEAIQHLREICEDVHLITIHRSQIRNLFSLAAQPTERGIVHYPTRLCARNGAGD